MMKIGIYTPYLDSFGGGERYILTAAEILSAEHSVDLLLDTHHLLLNPKNLISTLEKQLDLNLSKVNLIEAPLGSKINFIKRLFFWRNYDLLIYLTDGSIFYSTAKRNFIHFQVPFKNTAAKNLWGKIKLSSWNLAICNSKFTQDVIKKEWPIASRVVYPPVDINKIKPLPKKKYILSVGRFVSFTKVKKHEEMIRTFSNLSKIGKIKGWSLHLAGAVEGDESYLDELKNLAKDWDITFYTNYPFEKLAKLYGESSIYWHAAGFGETDPVKMEHFGITTVEAMASGCVPIVINKGGQPEIVENNISGLLWDKLDELKSLTMNVINDPVLMSKLSEKAIEKSKLFSKQNFKNKILKLIQVNK